MLFRGTSRNDPRMTTTTRDPHRNPNRANVDRLMPSRALPALLDFWTMCDVIGMRKDRSTRLFAWRGAKNGTFPAPVKVSEARIAWRRDEVERWLADRPRAIYAKARTNETPAAVEADDEPAPRVAVVETPRITQAPKACPECGSRLTASGGLYLCADLHALGCEWRAILAGSGTDAA